MIIRIRAALELMRPANIVTAFADIAAGFAAAGALTLWLQGSPDLLPGLAWLMAATLGLYGGGVVFNDVFDADLDRKERPERAIPQGRISILSASILGALLLIAGVFFAFQVHVISGYIALFIAVCALFYDAVAKHSVFWGPLCMGLCRGGNLMLGVSFFPAMVLELWFLALLPICYIAAITLISRGEVHGGKRSTGITGFVALLIVISGLFLFSLIPAYKLLRALPLIALFSFVVLPPFYKAMRTPSPEHIKSAVKKGVLSLILLNSVLVAGFAGLVPAIFLLLLLPVSLLLARLFAVT